MTATITRPKRKLGKCIQCGAEPNQYHKQSCSCYDLGHQWGPAIWDDEELAQQCEYCGQINGAARLICRPK